MKNSFRIIDLIRFLLVGGINALIYLFFVIGFIALTNNYYLSVAIAQVIMAVIAYYIFSRYHFRVGLKVSIFVRFIISNFSLFLVSCIIAWVSSKLNIGTLYFSIVNVLIVAPLSYISNTFLVFNNEI